MYNKKVIEHFKNPKNMGAMKDADAVGQVGNPVCGDILKLYIKVENDKIKKISFETLGCAAAIAVSSVITQMAKGKTLKDALGITKEDVAKKLGSLPSFKMHCSNLAAQALKEAVKNYEKEHQK